MKGSSKPISSPGRREKFPPPLMRFLKSNVGSRSRGRTRASPMFMRKNKNNVVIQEPSSPKVTCIGQVRVRRGNDRTRTLRSSSTRKQQQRERRNKKQRPCYCCYSNFRVKLHKPKSFISVLKKWACCLRFGHCGKRDNATSTSQVESSLKIETRASITTAETNENILKNEDAFVDRIANPPRDALILTRCRSAPYRSSSLASRFWGSPLNHHLSYDTTKSQSPQNILDNPISPEGENGKMGSRKSHQSEELTVPDTTKSRSPQNIVRELENEKPVLENPNGDLGSTESHESEEMKSSIDEEVYVHPLLLTRCKSEPARRGERLNPRRLTEPDSQS